MQPTLMTKVLLFVIVLLPISGFAQLDNQIMIINHKRSIIYLDNNFNTHFTISFQGDSILPTIQPNVFTIDKKQIVKIVKYPFSSSLYTPQDKPEKEVKLLKYFKTHEKEYLETEILLKRVDSKEEIITNKYGKRFLLWYVKVPSGRTVRKVYNTSAGLPGSLLEKEVKFLAYLTFVSNGNIGMINFPILDGQDPNKTDQALKELANEVSVYHMEIKTPAIFQRIDAQNSKKDFKWENYEYHFDFIVPDFLRVCETGKGNIWIGSLPEVDNKSHVVSLSWYDKENIKFTSLQAFTDHILKDKTIKKAKPTNHTSNEVALAMKVEKITSGRKQECHYLTMETPNAFLLITYIAHPKTYKQNIDRHMEFLKGIKIHY
jgi:hypothetical protein